MWSCILSLFSSKRRTERKYQQFYVAAAVGNTAKVKRMLRRLGAAGINFKRDEDRDRTPLHVAVLGTHVKIIKLLLQHGADATARDVGGATPLHDACRLCCPEVVELLLEQPGVDVNAREVYLYSLATPLQLAVYSPPAMPRTWSQLDEDDHDVLRAVKNQAAKLATVTLLLNHGADLTINDWNGNSPLHKAKTVAMAQCIMDHAKQPRKQLLAARNDKGQTPWQMHAGVSHVRYYVTATSPEVAEYLRNLEALPIAISQGGACCSKNALAVMANPELLPKQRAQTDALNLVLQATILAPVAWVILGYLAPVDVYWE